MLYYVQFSSKKNVNKVAFFIEGKKGIYVNTHNEYIVAQPNAQMLTADIGYVGIRARLYPKRGSFTEKAIFKRDSAPFVKTKYFDLCNSLSTKKTQVVLN